MLAVADFPLRHQHNAGGRLETDRRVDHRKGYTALEQRPCDDTAGGGQSLRISKNKSRCGNEFFQRLDPVLGLHSALSVFQDEAVTVILVAGVDYARPGAARQKKAWREEERTV